MKMTKRHMIKLFLWLVILCTIPLCATGDHTQKRKSKYKRYLSAVAIFRDEADYLKEWIEYHRLQGVEYFYLYNNLSVDHYRDVLKEYIDKKIVKLIDWPYEHDDVDKWDRIQCASYKNAIKRSQNSTKWLMILDTDEFFVPNQHANIPEMLRNQEKNDAKGVYAAYYFFWVVFGTSGVDRVPGDKLMIEMLTKNGGPHALYKCICRPKYVGTEINPHWVRLTSGKKGMMCSLDLLQINHYMYRDVQFLMNVKIPRREKIGTGAETILHWESCCDQENQYSTGILRFIPPLKKQMGLPL